MRIIILTVIAAFLSASCASSARLPLEARYRASIGKKVTLIGTADQAWGGAALSNDECYLVITDLASWPEGVLGQKIKVTGTLQSVDRPNGVTHTNYKEAPIMLTVTHAAWKK